MSKEMKTIKTILEDLCDDVAEDIILGNMQKQIHVNQALSEIEELIDGAKPPYENEHPVDSITGEPVETYGYEEVRNSTIDVYNNNLKKLLGDK